MGGEYLYGQMHSIAVVSIPELNRAFTPWLGSGELASRPRDGVWQAGISGFARTFALSCAWEVRITFAAGSEVEREAGAKGCRSATLRARAGPEHLPNGCISNGQFSGGEALFRGDMAVVSAGSGHAGSMPACMVLATTPPARAHEVS